jgi:hypothetical protein
MKKHFAIAFVRRVCTLVLGVSAVFLVHAHAQTAGDPNKYSTTPGNPACRFFDGFADNGDGTVTDPRNGLMWKRCAEGSTWNGKACSVAGTKMNWIEAMKTAKVSRFLGHSDWRLPSREELNEIVGKIEQCGGNDSRTRQYAASGAIAHAMNSNKWPGAFWTSSSHVGESVSASVGGFANGRVSGGFRGNGGNHVRLVRDTKTSNPLGAKIFQVEWSKLASYQKEIEREQSMSVETIARQSSTVRSPNFFNRQILSSDASTTIWNAQCESGGGVTVNNTRTNSTAYCWQRPSFNGGCENTLDDALRMGCAAQ